MGWPTSPKRWRVMRPIARKLRREQTEAEKRLWKAIRKEQIAGFRFQRQRVFEKYVADFYCPAARLAIEVDGPIHDLPNDDDNRQAYIESLEIRVIRFRNEEVVKQLPMVVRAIAKALLEEP